MFFFPQLRGVPGISSGSVDDFFSQLRGVPHLYLYLYLYLDICHGESRGPRVCTRENGWDHHNYQEHFRPLATPRGKTRL